MNPSSTNFEYEATFSGTYKRSYVKNVGLWITG